MTALPIGPFAASSVPRLSREHRVWIALYSLETGTSNRADVLRVNGITEDDLREFEASWLKMRCRVPASIARITGR